MEEDIVRLLREQERILGEIRSNAHRWMDELLRQAFDPESFLRLLAGMGMDTSRIPNLVGQQGGFDPYKILGMERSARDEEVKKRYNELLHVLHPDKSGTPGTGLFFQMVRAAFEMIKKERGWQ